MMRNFLFDIAGCKGSYSLSSRKESCIKHIQETVGKHKVLVDSLLTELISLSDVLLLLNTSMSSLRNLFESVDSQKHH